MFLQRWMMDEEAMNACVQYCGIVSILIVFLEDHYSKMYFNEACHVESVVLWVL